jgi:FKBP-type peptidyl-prolyl cis-trans isomerase FklB
MGRQGRSALAALAAGWLAVLAGLPAGVVAARAAESAGAAGTAALATPADRESYSLGVELGRNLRRQGFEADPEVAARGVRDALDGGTLLLTDEAIADALALASSELRARKGRARLLAGQDNRAEGEAFLAANQAREGVVTLPSGLQYTVLKAGEAGRPAAWDVVVFHERGTLIDGTEFESTSAAGQPATWRRTETRIIPALREALQLMTVGARWRLVVPPRLAYGGRGAGGVVGPNATLVYEVEVLAIK